MGNGYFAGIVRWKTQYLEFTTEEQGPVLHEESFS